MARKHKQLQWGFVLFTRFLVAVGSDYFWPERITQIQFSESNQHMHWIVVFRAGNSTDAVVLKKKSREIHWVSAAKRYRYNRIKPPRHRITYFPTKVGCWLAVGNLRVWPNFVDYFNHFTKGLWQTMCLLSQWIESDFPSPNRWCPDFLYYSQFCCIC